LRFPCYRGISGDINLQVEVGRLLGKPRGAGY